jgi:hypothetical protein
VVALLELAMIRPVSLVVGILYMLESPYTLDIKIKIIEEQVHASG